MVRATKKVRLRKGTKRPSGGSDGSNASAVLNKDVEFLSTGCASLDAIMGGGYAIGRVTNIVGDKSTGKTLLLIEACANLVMRYPKSRIRYVESESAFDKSYATSLGLPLSRVDFNEEIETVEELFADLDAVIKKRLAMIKDGKKLDPMIYCLDSLDSIGDTAELERDINKGSYGGGKPKKVGELFRRMIRKIEDARILLIIISQTRDKIGVTFGKKQTRSGGRALDFYATQVIWLSEIKKIYKTIRKVKRPVASVIRAKMDKNKVGLPFRECTYPVIYNFGIDDITSNIEYLEELNQLATAGIKGPTEAKRLITKAKTMDDAEVSELRKRLTAAVMEAFVNVEVEFLPTRKKYDGQS